MRPGKFAIYALWVAVVLQTLWIASQALQRHFSGIVYTTLVTIGFVALALTRGKVRWLSTVLRIFVGIAFLSSICDRLGFFGGRSAAGVSWGNFPNFIAYTAQVNSFLPAAVIPALAIVESVIEAALGLVMLIGAFLPWSLAASAALLSIFAIAMSLSLGIASTFPYAVFVMATGAWLLTESLASKRNERTEPGFAQEKSSPDQKG